MRRRSIMVVAFCGLLAGAMSPPAYAAVVTQLDFIAGSVDLNFGSLGTVSGSFSQNGTLVLGQYQLLPGIFPPVQVSHLSFSFFTSFGHPVLNLSTPSGTTSGNTMTVDLTSLFAGVSSTAWGSWMTPQPVGSLNIGGVATGAFDQTTNAFDIFWTYPFTGIPFLTNATFSLQGTAQLAAVPLPAAVVLFATGIAALGSVSKWRRRKSRL